MDGGNFDGLTRRLAGTASRRSMVRGVLGGVVAAVGVRDLAGAAPAAKVDICHYSKSTNTFAPITVSGNAVPAHMAHGDQICSNPDNGTSTCMPSGCAVTCDEDYSPCDAGCCLNPPQCWWMENYGNSSWIPTGFDYGTCKSQDSCSGGGGQSGGGCYKWTSGPNDQFSSWPS